MRKFNNHLAITWIMYVFLAGLLWQPAFFVYTQTEGDAPQFTIHVVQRGENLFRIALGYGLTTDVVAQANGILDPSNIQVGQRLIIPTNGSVTAMPQASQEHIVQAGESLLSIANFYRISVETLASLNNIIDPNSIYVGQLLSIGANPPAVVESSPSTTSAIHVVQSGETLFRIATQYGSSVSAVQQANSITDPTVIYAGQELIIPGVEPLQIAFDLPEGITLLDVKPMFFVEGNSGRILLNTANPSTLTGTFLNQNLQIISDGTGTSHIMLIGIPIYTQSGVYPLGLTITSSTGEVIPLTANIQVLAGGYASQSIILPDDRLDLLAPAIEENELAILHSVTSIFNPERYFTGSMSLPAAAAMNSPYGTRRSYNGGPIDRYHNGTDFAGAPGSPILAAAPGRVVLADALHIRGNSVVIDHGWGVYTNYSHMTERYVQLGDFVSTGQTIGTVGNTGRATGAHLHWELWLNGIPVDPMQWVIESFP